MSFPTLDDLPESGQLSIEPWHGSLYGYNTKGCRCEGCTEASRAYREQVKARSGEPVSICECGRLLPHKGRCDTPVPTRMPFNW